MVRLSNGVHVKVKTKWWVQGTVARGAWRKGLELAYRREIRHGVYCEDRRLRLVVEGLGVEEPPVRVMQWEGCVVKVEATYSAKSGVRGVVLASFTTVGEAMGVMQRRGWKRAHSNRTRESGLVVVKRWWRDDKQYEQ